MSTTAVLVCAQQNQQIPDTTTDDPNAETPTPSPLLLVRPNLEPLATAADLKRDVCALLGVPTAAAASRAFFGGRALDDGERLADAGVPTSPRALQRAPGGGGGGGDPSSGAVLRAAGADERLYPDGWTQGGPCGHFYLRKRDRAWPPERDAERVGAWPLWALLLAALLLARWVGV